MTPGVTPWFVMQRYVPAISTAHWERPNALQLRMLIKIEVLLRSLLVVSSALLSALKSFKAAFEAP